jgi:hypothetical protein
MRFDRFKRRNFIPLIASATPALPLIVQAPQDLQSTGVVRWDA